MFASKLVTGFVIAASTLVAFAGNAEARDHDRGRGDQRRNAERAGHRGHQAREHRRERHEIRRHEVRRHEVRRCEPVVCRPVVRPCPPPPRCEAPRSGVTIVVRTPTITIGGRSGGFCD